MNKANNKKKTGILLVNLGTPDAPDVRSVRRYLDEFLSDRRVVEIPRPIWWLMLHGLILRTRPRRSAKAYQSVWMDEGSPLLVHTQRLAGVMREKLKQGDNQQQVTVEVGMRYGNPSINNALDGMTAANVDKIIVLPLYPQYSSTTTASVFDAVQAYYSQRRYIPELRLISDYHANQGYIAALTAKIRAFWDAKGKQAHLLMSFHGLPARNIKKGDPYLNHCQTTATLLATSLGLTDQQWDISFQSRLGKAEWIKPYTSTMVKQLAVEGTKNLDVVCPGFPVDCLETVEEIAIENRQYFLQAGGEIYRYIPALNDSRVHASALLKLCGPL